MRRIWANMNQTCINQDGGEFCPGFYLLKKIADYVQGDREKFRLSPAVCGAGVKYG